MLHREDIQGIVEKSTQGRTLAVRVVGLHNYFLILSCRVSVIMGDTPD